ncbi:MAG: hypothetical protein JST19_17350 [Bacteroidetes bacterium]|nr:hypothetical protein [Bacteroidota bacterium]
MKSKYLLATVLLALTFSQSRAQHSSDMQAMHMIKDFYTDYSLLNLKTADTSKLEALIDKYFTVKEGKLLKEGYKKGHDIMTNDSGITVRSLETMVISSVSDEKALNIQTGKYEIVKGIKDAYEISYVVHPVTPKLNKTTTETGILIDIIVVKINDTFKISYVCNGLTDNLRNRKSIK